MSDIQYQKHGSEKIFHRLFVEDNQKYLLADEVGLGKTITAAEVLVRLAIKRWKEGRGIKIAYICSNLALASQNVQKLKKKINEIVNKLDYELARELTVKNMATERLSLGFLTFDEKCADSKKEMLIYTITPSTTIKVSSKGTKEERMYAYCLFYENEDEDTWFKKFCSQTANPDNWEKELKKIREDEIKSAKITEKRADFQKKFKAEWDENKKQIIHQFVETAIEGFPEFYFNEQDYMAYSLLLNILEENQRKGTVAKGTERLVKNGVEKKKEELGRTLRNAGIDLKWNFSEEDIRRAEYAIQNLNNDKHAPYIRAIKLGAEENLQALSDYIENNCELRNWTYYEDIQQEINSYIKYGFEPTGLFKPDSRFKTKEKAVEAAFRKTCYSQIMIMARKCMVEISMDSMRMDLFVADEIQNYSDIFRKQKNHNSESEYNRLIDRVIDIKNKSKVLMMSATPFRYHSIMNALENAQKEADADSDTDGDADERTETEISDSQRYLEEDTDIYDEFQNIVRYLMSSPQENLKDDMWFREWETENRKKQSALSGALYGKACVDDCKGIYKHAVQKQSDMMQKANISRVERYMANITSRFRAKEIEIPIDNILLEEMKRMADAQTKLPFCDTDTLSSDYIIIRAGDSFYVATGDKNHYCFCYADGRSIDALRDSEDDEDDEAECKAWEVLYDPEYEFIEGLGEEETCAIYSELKKALNRNTVRLDYQMSTPAVCSFGEGYVSLDSSVDKNGHNTIPYDLVHQYRPLFAVGKNPQKDKAPLYNARMNRLFEKLFDEEEQHKLLFIPPTCMDANLKGVYEGKRGVSKRLFFSDYKMIPRSLSSLITYEAERRVVDDLKKRYSDTDKQIKVYKGDDSPVLDIAGLFEQPGNFVCKSKDSIASMLFAYDKLTHTVGNKRAGSVYDYACQKRVLQDKEFHSDEQIETFCKAYYKYMCRVNSLRVVLAYVEDGETLYDKILTYGENGCIWDVLDEFEVYCKKFEDESFPKAFARIMDIEFGQIKAKAKGEREHCVCSMNTDFATGHFSGDKGIHTNSSAKTLENKMTRFNSPFWPFQFISTSIGQEGFDFHVYCRKVVHWSLEYNPIKFEQREGRINRYQGYANRLQLAIFMRDKGIKFNGWHSAFEDVRKSDVHGIKKLVDDSKGLFPDFVVVEDENNMYGLERECYYYPYSFESHKFADVLKCVGYYRSLLGQPGNDKFEECFQTFIDENNITDVENYFVDLYPSPESK